MTKTLYLDQADLAAISDGDAKHVEALREALRTTRARLVVSQAHVYDLANADDATRRRWAATAAELAPVVYAHEPGEKVPASEPRLLSLFPLFEEIFSGLPMMMAVYLNSINELRTAPPELREAFNAQTKAEKTRRQRELAEAAKESLAMIGKTVEEIVEDGLAPALQAIEDRDDVGEYLRRRRTADRARVPLGSDIIDEMHARFAIHADVFTVDKNIAHLMAGAEPTLERRGYRFRMVRVRHLDQVAEALLAGT